MAGTVPSLTPRVITLAAVCLATLLLISACSRRTTEQLPPGDGQAPPTSIVTVTLHDDSIVPLDPETGASGVHDAELTIWRDGSRVFLDEEGNETDAAGAVAIILSNAAVLSGQLTVQHGDYAVDLAARDSAGRVVASGSAAASISGPLTVRVPLLSLAGSATLQASDAPAPGEPIEAVLTVQPFAGSGLVVPPAGFDVEWKLTGEASLRDPGKASAHVIPEGSCSDTNVTATINRAGETQVAAIATLELDADLYCEESAIGLEDSTPPSVTLEPLTRSAMAGTLLRMRGIATDEGSGMATVQVYDGPVLRQTATFDDGQTQWQARIQLGEARMYDLTIIATDRAGNQARVRHVVSVSAAP